MDVKRLRWDKANLAMYYDLTYQCVSSVNVPVELLHDEVNSDGKAAECNNQYYAEIVHARTCAASYAVPRTKQNYFKFWWDEECDALKDESISSHRAWVTAGKPHDGAIAVAMRKAKYAYKHALKRKRGQEHNTFTNELHEALLEKDFSTFWKTWNTKFGSRLSSQVVNWFSDHASIAETFCNTYSTVFTPNNKQNHNQLQQKFQAYYAHYTGDNGDIDSMLTVELVDRVCRELKRGRSAGPDEICAEHLLYSHPLLIVQLSLLFT